MIINIDRRDLSLAYETRQCHMYMAIHKIVKVIDQL
jgi:hypothetical protein